MTNPVEVLKSIESLNAFTRDSIARVKIFNEIQCESDIDALNEKFGDTQVDDALSIQTEATLQCLNRGERASELNVREFAYDAKTMSVGVGDLVRVDLQGETKFGVVVDDDFKPETRLYGYPRILDSYFF